VPELVEQGLACGNDIAVKFRELTGYAILCHSIGGICAGMSAHWIYTFLL